MLACKADTFVLRGYALASAVDGRAALRMRDSQSSGTRRQKQVKSDAAGGKRAWRCQALQRYKESLGFTRQAVWRIFQAFGNHPFQMRADAAKSLQPGESRCCVRRRFSRNGFTQDAGQGSSRIRQTAMKPAMNVQSAGLKKGAEKMFFTRARSRTCPAHCCKPGRKILRGCT